MIGDLIRHWPDLALVYGAFFVAIASPGPSNLTVMATAMEHGRRAGQTVALGVTTGSLTWGVLAALGVSALVAAHPGTLHAIKLVGGVYLLFLAWRSARAAMRVQPPPAKAAVSGRRLWLIGLLMHLTNPKAILSWTAIIALGLRPDMPAAVVVAIVAGCGLLSLATNQLYALLFSTPAMVAGYRKVRRRAEAGLAAFFAFAGFRLLTAP